jgi:hypothetical protein
MALTLDPVDTRQRIHQLVWNGFHPDASVAGMITDSYLPTAELNDEDRSWVELETQSVCADKHAAEDGWPAQTEYDLLESAFVQLRKDKFIAVHNAGTSLGASQQDVQSLWRAAGGFNSGIRGCCFYLVEDVTQAIATGRLTIAFSGAMIPESNKREANSRLAARRVLEALRAVKLLPEWSGELSARIQLPLGQWRKRAPLA